MQVDAESPEVAIALRRTAATIRAGGGFVADDFTVRERCEQFSCAIGEQFGVAGRCLISYPTALTVPMHLLQWADRPDALELADPAAARRILSRTQWRLLVDWLIMVNAVDRLAHVRATMPRFRVVAHTLRHHLADAGYPSIREAFTDEDVRECATAWHSMGAGLAPDGTQRWRLIPLKNLVNHHPSGSEQMPEPGRTAVITSAASDGTETFENYGDLDALQLLMNFGYVDHSAPVVHSVPVEVESPAIGRVVVRWRAPRNPRGATARDVPEVSRLGTPGAQSPSAGADSTPDDEASGIELRHLDFRADNRDQVASYLAMACQSLTGQSAEAARREAESILDAILAANQDYYRRLDELVATSAQPYTALAEVSLLQQQGLRSLWG